MNAIRGVFVAAVLAAGVIACDQSKAELDQAKVQLQTITAERDALKAQITTLQGQVTALTQQLADANAKLVAAAQPAPEAQTPASGHRAQPSKSSTQRNTEARKAAEQQMSGGSSMNN